MSNGTSRGLSNPPAPRPLKKPNILNTPHARTRDDAVPNRGAGAWETKTCGASRRGRWRGWRRDSRARLPGDQADEDVFERALARLEIANVEPELGELADERRDLRPVPVLVERVDELVTVARELERVGGE